LISPDRAANYKKPNRQTKSNDQKRIINSAEYFFDKQRKDRRVDREQAIGNSLPGGNRIRITAMTKQADNRMAKKNGEAMPATAAATNDTNAKDNMTLPRSGNQWEDFFMGARSQSREPTPQGGELNERPRLTAQCC
jgi:hypothetical protein